MSKTRDLYKIGDLTKKLKITPRTIRYYDQLGLLPNIKRSDGDTRIFDNIDIALIEKTRYYQKTNFLPLFEIKSKLFPTALNKYKLVEVPIVFTDRVKGQSKMSKGIISEAVIGVVKMKLKSIFNK